MAARTPGFDGAAREGGSPVPAPRRRAVQAGHVASDGIGAVCSTSGRNIECHRRQVSRAMQTGEQCYSGTDTTVPRRLVLCARVVPWGLTPLSQAPPLRAACGQWCLSPASQPLPMVAAPVALAEIGYRKPRAGASPGLRRATATRMPPSRRAERGVGADQRACSRDNSPASGWRRFGVRLAARPQSARWGVCSTARRRRNQEVSEMLRAAPHRSIAPRSSATTPKPPPCSSRSAARSACAALWPQRSRHSRGNSTPGQRGRRSDPDGILRHQPGRRIPARVAPARIENSQAGAAGRRRAENLREAPARPARRSPGRFRNCRSANRFK